MRSYASLPLLLCLVTLTRGGEPPYFTSIGVLPGGANNSFAAAISGNGQVIVGDAAIGFGASIPIRWTREAGLEEIPLPANVVLGWARDVTFDGSMIVGGTLRTDNKNEAFVWTAATGMVGIGDLPGGRFSSDANGVSSDGTYVVGIGRTEYSQTHEAFRWDAINGMIPLGDLPGSTYYSSALAVSSDGELVVGFSNATIGGISNNEGFRWTPETGMLGIGTLPDYDDSLITAISPKGVMTGACSSFEVFGNIGFRWTPQRGMLPLHRPEGESYTPMAITADGQTIVGQGRVIAFIWDAQRGSRPLATFLNDEIGLDVTDWTLVAATDISADGRTIIGHGAQRDVIGTQGWVAYLGEVPPPCPGDMDDDGAIGIVDLGHLLEHFGETFNASPADGDLDLDTDIDIDDLALLLSRFGQLCPTE